MNGLPDYQVIEDAYRVVQEVISKLPDSTESRRAKDNLEISQKLTYEARERAKADRTETVPALATGDWVPGAPYIVGERGPETVTACSGGSINIIKES